MTDASKEAARVRFTGANHPRWKGGVYINDRGYKYIRPPEGFPWPEMINRRGYIREHRVLIWRRSSPSSPPSRWATKR